MSAKEIRQVGVGELLARIEALKEKLALEGLFNADRKIALPRLPRTVGLIWGTRGRGFKSRQPDWVRGAWPSLVPPDVPPLSFAAPRPSSLARTLPN